MNDGILSLLGLALRGGRLAVGDEPAALAAEAGKARLILLACDAGERTLRRGPHLAEAGHCLHIILPFSKTELGGALGRGGAAIMALTDLGLAAALVRKLAVLDPERYEETSRRMELKLRRAQERKTAPRRQPPPSEGRPDRRRSEGGPRKEGGQHASGRGGPRKEGGQYGPGRGGPRRTGGKKRPGSNGANGGRSGGGY